MKTIVIAVTLACVFGAEAWADPLTYSTKGIVGTFDGKTTNSSPPEELVVAQSILDLVGLGTFSNVGCIAAKPNCYKNSTFKDYEADLSNAAQGPKNGRVVPAAFDYVLAKYDGQNGGYVLFYLPDFGSHTLAQYPANFWTTQTDKYAISHFTTFDAVSIAEVDDGGTTIALLAVALCGLAIAWRRVGILYDSQRHSTHTVL